MKMNKSSVKIFFSILSILILFFLAFFIIIKFNIFPDLTKNNNEIIAKILLDNSNPNFENSVPIKNEKIILESGEINFSEIDFSFCSVEGFTNELIQFKTTYNIDGIEFVLLDNNTTIQATGVLSRFSSDYDINFPVIDNWIFKNDFPIISSLGFYQNVIVFIDATLKFHFVNILNGQEILFSDEISKNLFSPIYPTGNIFANSNGFVFEGRDKNIYVLSFTNEIDNLKIQQEYYIDATSFFEISEEAKNHIKDYVSNWMSLSGEFELPQIKIIPDGINPIPLEDEDLIIYAYCPDWSGIKTVGLCDENSSWINSYTFISIFTNDGELRSVSMDYVADNPQLELHHSESDSNFYYFVIGKLPHNEDTQQLFFTIK